MIQAVIQSAEKRFFYVENRAGSYRTQFELASEVGLANESSTAVWCFDFADLVSQGNNVYQSIQSLDNDWRMLVFSGELQFLESFENRITKLYKVWLEVSKSVVQLYSKIESEFATHGFDVGPVHTLRDAVREIEGAVQDDSHYFDHPKLVALRDKAIDDFRTGNDIDFTMDAAK